MGKTYVELQTQVCGVSSEVTSPCSRWSSLGRGWDHASGYRGGGGVGGFEVCKDWLTNVTSEECCV